MQSCVTTVGVVLWENKHKSTKQRVLTRTGLTSRYAPPPPASELRPSSWVISMEPNPSEATEFDLVDPVTAAVLMLVAMLVPLMPMLIFMLMLAISVLTVSMTLLVLTLAMPGVAVVVAVPSRMGLAVMASASTWVVLAFAAAE